jgi:MFS family permease
MIPTTPCPPECMWKRNCATRFSGAFPAISGSVVGLIEGVAQATQNVVQGFSGWLSDRLQKRKSIALAGYLLAAIAGCGVQLRVPSR